MAITYFALATSTVGAGGTNGFTFNNIPQTYTDLVIQLSVRSSSASGLSDCFIYVNGVTGSAYDQVRFYSLGSTSASDNQSAISSVNMINSIPNATNQANQFSTATIYIPNYTSGNSKSISANIGSALNTSTNYMGMADGIYTQATAISRIDIDGTDNFVQYSTAVLYGILKA